MLDETKPSNNWVYELTLYDEKDNSGTDDNLTLRPVPFESTSNSEGWFSKGLKKGKWVFNESDFAKIEEHYKNGVRDGEYIVYGKNDSILYQTSFKDGTGVEKIYKKNGSLYHIKHYKNGSIDSSKLFTLHYDNGNIAEEFDFQKKTRKAFYKDESISRLEVCVTKNDIGRNIVTQLKTVKIYDRQGIVRERKYYEDDNWTYTILYNKKQRIERVESGNMIQHFNKKKLKNIKFKKYNHQEKLK